MNEDRVSNRCHGTFVFSICFAGCLSLNKKTAFKKDRKVSYLRFRMDPPHETKNNEDYEFELNLKFADHRLASLVAPWQLKTRIDSLWRKLHFCMRKKTTKSLGKNVNMTSSKKTVLQTIGPLRKMLNWPTFWHPDGWGQRDGSSHLL